MKSTIELTGRSFHGPFILRLRAQAGDRLSPSQERRLWSALCGVTDCCCGLQHVQWDGGYWIEDTGEPPYRLRVMGRSGA